MMPFKMGPWEIVLILAIILIVFGVGKLPQVGGAIGKGLRAFKKGQEDDEENDVIEVAKNQKTRMMAVRKETAVKS